MSDFKAKRHQIRSRWGSLQRSPDSLAVFKGPTSKERGGRRKGNGKGEERERGREGKGRGLEGPPFRVGIGPP